MKQSPSRASEFFDAYAEDFSAIYGNKHTLLNRMVNSMFRKSMRLRYQKTMEGCQPLAGRTVIDIGCGPGHYSVALAKAGAANVFGIDFAEGMIDIAKKNAAVASVTEYCHFEYDDFFTRPIEGKFDYAIVMGFMDYIREPEEVIQRVLGFTSRRAFFSFPMDGGILAWQRQLRYKNRCELYMYTPPQLRQLFANLTTKPFTIERIDRDSFVTVQGQASSVESP
jgi:SAM-dependent methyltransferase